MITTTKTKKFLYVASPFNHDDEKIRDMRVEEVEKFTAFLQNKFHKEYLIFSPIAHSGHMYKYMEKKYQRSYDFWIFEVDDYFLEISDELVVLCIDGWDRSAGCKYEIAKARSKNIPIRYFEKKKWKGKTRYICVKEENVCNV